jgi:hypothetical protein
MEWLLSEKLEEQRNDVAKNLYITISVPPSGNPFNSVIGIQNRSAIGIESLQIVCSVHVLMSLATYSNLWYEFYPDAPIPIGPRTDGQTEACLTRIPHYFQVKTTGFRCADMTILFAYSLDTQPKEIQKISIRFASHEEKRNYTWYQRPIDDKNTYCEIDTSTPVPSLKQRTLRLVNELEHFERARDRDSWNQGILGHEEEAGMKEKLTTFDDQTIQQFRSQFAKKINAIVAEFRARHINVIDVPDVYERIQNWNWNGKNRYAQRLAKEFAQYLRGLSGQIDDNGNLH